MNRNTGNAVRQHKYPLPAEHVPKLRQMIAAHGSKTAARLLKCGEMTVIELATGGGVKPTTLERVVMALEGVEAA